MSPRPDVSEERTQQIIEAALAVFSERGFHEARMSDVADAAGLSKAALYLYFESKDDLIRSLLEQIVEREIAMIAHLSAETGSASQRMREFADLVVADLAQMRALIPLFYEFFALGLHHGAIHDELSIFVQRFLAVLIPIIQQGMARGEFRQADAEEVAIAIGAIIEGTLLLWIYDPDTVDIARHIQAGIDLVLAGLQPR